jgi:heme/copper-type cytochrome/quinol oxidase subunit 3
MPTATLRRPNNAIIGMAFWLIAEGMFFCGLISAYLVARAHSAAMWPPADQPRLPVAQTAVNSLFLLASAATMAAAWRAGGAAGRVRALAWTGTLGLLFVLLQGREWARLLAFGLTTRSSLYGAFFYTLIGIHGAHVAAGIVFLALAATRQREAGAVGESWLAATGAYWMFVVAVWPVLYGLVYLW